MTEQGYVRESNSGVRPCGYCGNLIQTIPDLPDQVRQVCARCYVKHGGPEAESTTVPPPAPEHKKLRCVDCGADTHTHPNDRYISDSTELRLKCGSCARKQSEPEPKSCNSCGVVDPQLFLTPDNERACFACVCKMKERQPCANCGALLTPQYPGSGRRELCYDCCDKGRAKPEPCTNSPASRVMDEGHVCTSSCPKCARQRIDLLDNELKTIPTTESDAEIGRLHRELRELKKKAVQNEAAFITWQAEEEELKRDTAAIRARLAELGF